MKLSRTLFTLTASVGLVLAAAPQVAAEPAQTPLYLLGGVDPNIMFIIDDSGSMNLAFVPDTLCSLRTTKRVKSAAVNTLYYDRNVTYPAPLNHDNSSLGDASFTAAWTNGYDLAGRASSTVNLSTSFRPNWSGSTTGCSDSSTYAHTTVEAAYYYVFDSTNTSCDGTLTDDDCYDKVVVSSTSGPSSSDERTNFANWYSYYRTRLLTTKAGASRAFAPQGTSIRVGYGRINDGTATSIDSVSVTTIVRGVRPFSSTDRQDFFTWLFGLGTQTYTPLRRALDDAGKYFSSGGTDGPWSSTPGTTGGTLASCRQSFTILTTDGYWNDAQASTAAARDNNDGSAGPTVTGPASTSYTYSAVSPFTDSRSNTLADVAMYYWKRDLLSSVANRGADHHPGSGILATHGDLRPRALGCRRRSPPRQPSMRSPPGRRSPGPIR
jgi:type IV pilus assembly protein PilY1